MGLLPPLSCIATAPQAPLLVFDMPACTHAAGGKSARLVFSRVISRLLRRAGRFFAGNSKSTSSACVGWLAPVWWVWVMLVVVQLKLLKVNLIVFSCFLCFCLFSSPLLVVHSDQGQWHCECCVRVFLARQLPSS